MTRSTSRRWVSGSGGESAAAIVQEVLDRGGTPSMLWQLPQYLLLTVGEALVAVTALEFGYAQAPRAMRLTVQACGVLTGSVGNLFTAAVTKLVPLEGAAYFWFFAGLMLAAALAFRWVARSYRGAPAPAAAAE